MPGITPVATARGFTLIELMVVLTLVALVTGLVAFTLRPSAQQQLNREAERLSVWLESLRNQSRGQGLWAQVVVAPTGAQLVAEPNPNKPPIRLNWLYADTTTAAPVTLTLGPEPVVQAQQVQLISATDPKARVTVATPGLAPWGWR